jgi:molecular chaperone GrpE (heat shock protein)
MKREKNGQVRVADKSLIGEMMIAKTVIEEKNELLDRKDRTIRELETRLQQLQTGALASQQELERCWADTEAAREEALKKGRMEAIGEVVGLAADYEYDGHRSGTCLNLASRLIQMFREKYGLQVIDTVSENVDPGLHRVIEVVHSSAENEPGLKVLAKGYHVNGKVIRPALIKVIEEPTEPEGA